MSSYIFTNNVMVIFISNFNSIFIVIVYKYILIKMFYVKNLKIIEIKYYHHLQNYNIHLLHQL